MTYFRMTMLAVKEQKAWTFLQDYVNGIACKWSIYTNIYNGNGRKWAMTRVQSVDLAAVIKKQKQNKNRLMQNS